MGGYQDLGELQQGQSAVIRGISDRCPPDIRQRLTDLGFLNGAAISVQGVSPLGDPTAYLIYDTLFSLRKEDARFILIDLKEEAI